MPDRDIPHRIEDRLIVALDVANVDAARALLDRLGDAVSFFKLGPRLAFAAGFDGLIEATPKSCGRRSPGAPARRSRSSRSRC
jgi:orotidine-5'-phosphate decarboxylase